MRRCWSMAVYGRLSSPGACSIGAVVSGKSRDRRDCVIILFNFARRVSS